MSFFAESKEPEVSEDFGVLGDLVNFAKNWVMCPVTKKTSGVPAREMIKIGSQCF